MEGDDGLSSPVATLASPLPPTEEGVSTTGEDFDFSADGDGEFDADGGIRSVRGGGGEGGGGGGGGVGGGGGGVEGAVVTGVGSLSIDGKGEIVHSRRSSAEEDDEERKVVTDDRERAVSTVGDDEVVIVGEEDEERGGGGGGRAAVVGADEETVTSNDYVILRTPEEDGMENVMPRVDRWRTQDPNDPGWRKHKKHVFVLSNAGKPIYSRYGDEELLAPFIAALSAVISFVRDADDVIRTIFAGEHKIVFMIQGSLYLAIAARGDEAESQLIAQLYFVHAQIISILTKKAIDSIFSKKSGYDLRNLLGDSGPALLTSLVRTMEGRSSIHGAFSFLLGVPSCLRLSPATRNEVAKVMQASRKPAVLYAMLLSNYQVVHIMRQRKVPLHPHDLLIVMNVINSSTSFQRSETFMPLALPKYKPDALVFACVSYIAPNLCLVLVTQQGDNFPVLIETKNTIVQGLTDARVLPTLTAAAASPSFSVADLTPYDLRHFLYKNFTFNQFAAPAFEAPLTTRNDQAKLFCEYQNLFTSLELASRPHRIVYHSSPDGTVLTWLTSEFLLFATFGPLITKAQATSTCNRLTRWLKREEESLFAHFIQV